MELLERVERGVLPRGLRQALQIAHEELLRPLRQGVQGQGSRLRAGRLPGAGGRGRQR